MTAKQDVTPEQWRLIANLPIEVAAAASVADPTHQAASTREILAALSTLLSGVKLLRHNELVQAVFDDYKADGRGEAAILKLSQDPPPDLVDATLEHVREAVALLASRPDQDEVAEFKLWLRGIASDIVASSASGGFLGIGGAPVSEEEVTFLARLTKALGLADAEET